MRRNDYLEWVIVIDWSKYPNFTPSEFRCKHTGQIHVDAAFMGRLQRLRDEFGKPMIINSGYRHSSHPEEAGKTEPGAHTSGRACDIRVQGSDALRLITLAVKHGFTGIGVNQKGPARFIHLDDLEHQPNRPRPWVWSY